MQFNQIITMCSNLNTQTNNLVQPRKLQRQTLLENQVTVDCRRW